MNWLFGFLLALMLLMGAGILDVRHHSMYAASNSGCDPHCSVCPGTYYAGYSGVCDWTKDPE